MAGIGVGLSKPGHPHIARDAIAAPDPPALFPNGLPIPMEAVPGIASVSAQTCNACHYAIYDEWTESSLARAGQNPRFQQAVQDAGSPTACKACHLPISSQHAQIAEGYTNGDLSKPILAANPGWDPTLQIEGVTCAACHVRNGVILARRVSGRASPHPVQVSEELSSPMMCAPCHQLSWAGAAAPYYDTYGEWYASAYRQAGVTCQDCHMPQAVGLVTTGHFAAHSDHRFEADPERALTVLIGLERPAIQRGTAFPFSVKLQNTGAGHHFPTGSPARTCRLEAGTYRDDKPLHAPFVYDFARVLSPDSPFAPQSDTRIPSGEEISLNHTATITQETAAGRAEFRVTLTWSGAPEPFLRRVVPVTLE